MMRAPLDDDVVADLRASRRIVGELLPVIVDQRGRVINGRHRLAAGWKTKVVRPVRDDEEYAILRLHFLAAQRMSSIAERAEAIAYLCGVYETRGMEGQRLVKAVIDKSPLTRTYTYELIPDRHKRSGGYERRREIQPSEFVDRPQVVDGVTIRPRPPPSERVGLVQYPCPACGCPGAHD